MPVKPTSPTRRALLNCLKQQGPHDAASLAGKLGLSAMAVRQHLYALEREKLVEHQLQQRPRGRPAKLWQLTAAADRFFPDGHAELSVDLIHSLAEAFGPAGMERLLAERARRQIGEYTQRVPRRGPLVKRLQALCSLRSDEGYMAEVHDDDGGWLFVENHCPICTAATACTGLCAAELDVFQAVLGPDVAIERSEHIVAGARRCAYRVQAVKPQRRPRRR